MGWNRNDNGNGVLLLSVRTLFIDTMGFILNSKNMVGMQAASSPEHKDTPFNLPAGLELHSCEVEYLST